MSKSVTILDLALEVKDRWYHLELSYATINYPQFLEKGYIDARAGVPLPYDHLMPDEQLAYEIGRLIYFELQNYWDEVVYNMKIFKGMS